MKPTSLLFSGPGFVFLVIVTIAFAAKIVWDKWQGRKFDASLIPTMLIIASVWLGFALRVLADGWLSWTLLAVQFVLVAAALQKPWPAFKKMLGSS